jgi:TolB-like protein
LPDRPSVAVLPFTNKSGDPKQDFFIDGIGEEIIIALSKVRWFFVIARQSSFAYRDKGMDAKQIARELGVRYVLVGSVRQASDRIRVSTQLIEGSSGDNVWARSYDRAAADVFAVQDEITQMIVGAIEPQLSRAERERARVRARDNVDAWSAYQHGMHHLYRCTREDLLEARRLFQQAIAVDPELGPAYSGEAKAYYCEVVYGVAESNQGNREKAIGPARRAVTLNAEDAGAHCTLGRICYLRREYPPALSELKTALELNPSLKAVGDSPRYSPLGLPPPIGRESPPECVNGEGHEAPVTQTNTEIPLLAEALADFLDALERCCNVARAFHLVRCRRQLVVRQTNSARIVKEILAAAGGGHMAKGARQVAVQISTRDGEHYYRSRAASQHAGEPTHWCLLSSRRGPVSAQGGARYFLCARDNRRALQFDAERAACAPRCRGNWRGTENGARTGRG